MKITVPIFKYDPFPHPTVSKKINVKHAGNHKAKFLLEVVLDDLLGAHAVPNFSKSRGIHRARVGNRIFIIVRERISVQGRGHGVHRSNGVSTTESHALKSANPLMSSGRRDWNLVIRRCGGGGAEG